MITSLETIEQLEDIRRRLCHYGGQGRCDCKFWMYGKSNGEFSGCAELYQLIAHLKGETTWHDRMRESFKPGVVTDGDIDG